MALHWRYSAWTIKGADYADGIAFLAHTLAQAQSLLHSLDRAVGRIGLYMNADKTDYMCFYQRGDISSLNGTIYQPLRSGRIWHKVNF